MCVAEAVVDEAMPGISLKAGERLPRGNETDVCGQLHLQAKKGSLSNSADEHWGS